MTHPSNPFNGELMSTLFNRLLKEKKYLVADGAIGTNLFAVGLVTGDAPELWSVDQPEKIANMCRGFIDAGSDIILTNTFGANRYRLKLHGAESRVRELNIAAVEILKAEVAKSGREVVIAGSMGPTGEFLQPTGVLSHKDAVAAFEEQALALEEASADVLWIETISSVEEVRAALEGAAVTNLPVVYTMSVDTNGRTMMGVTPAELVHIPDDMDVNPCGCGTNCGVGASEVVAAIINMVAGLDGKTEDAVLIAKANCGIPEYVDGKIVYNGTPEIMADYARMAFDAGAKIIGGCCGTSPVHVAAMRQALDKYEGGPVPDARMIQERLGELSKGALAQLGGDLSIAGGSSGEGGTRASRRRRK